MQTYKLIIIGLMLLTGFISCDDMNSIHQKYLDQPEKIYLGRTDSLKALPGKNRIKLVWYISADPKIQETVIYWNQRKDSIIKPFVRKVPGVQKDSLIINNLSGTYTFELYNRNDYGDKSLMATVSGTAYGDDYINSLKNRSITTFAVSNYSTVSKSGTVTITWGTPDPLCVFTNLSYKKHSTGEQVNLIVTSDVGIQTTVLTDVGNNFMDTNDMINISSLFVPVKGAIDSFPANLAREQLALYKSSGTRVEYNAAGTLTSTNPFSNVAKNIRKITDNVFYCDPVAAYAMNTANTMFRLMINPDNTVSISGYYNGVTNFIANNETDVSTYNPTTKTFVLKYRQTTASDKTYRIVTETLTLQ
jgi:hypothetical protein